MRQFSNSQGVAFHVELLSGDLKTIEKYLQSYSMEALQGFAFGADALKSLILTVACIERRLTVRNRISNFLSLPFTIPR